MESRVLADRYELIERIGSGGMGSVWRAHDRVLGRDVAVKLLQEGLAADTTFSQRFHNEARSAARLTHPNIVAVFDTGEHEGIPFIVMELVEGESLHTILSRGGPLAVEETARIGRGILGALAHAHGRGLVHRDMKPANVIVEDHTRAPKVADFGIAKGLEDSGGLTRTGGLIGTAAYLSPEQVSGGSATPASDVYAVGCLLYACLAGDPPFGGTTPVAIAMQHLHEPVPPVRERRPDVPPQLAAVLNRSLEKDPARRYHSAAEMNEALAATGLGGGPPTDMGVAETVAMGGTAPMPARVRTQRLERARRPAGPAPTNAAKVLAAISAVLIVAAAIWLAVTYLQTREAREGSSSPAPTIAAPTLAPAVVQTPAPTPAPTPTPTAAPSPTVQAPENPRLPDLPGMGGDD